MFNPKTIAKGVKADFANEAVAAFASKAPRVAYGTAGFRTIGSALPPIAYRCVFVVLCRALNVRLSLPATKPIDSHHFLVNPATIGDCGMMITASHNPAKDNGLKIIDPDGGMFTMDWESDATDVANIADPTAFGEALTAFAKQHLVMGAIGEEEAALYKLLRERPVRIHVGRDTRASGDAILASVNAAAAAINATFGPIVYASGEDSNPIIELIDHGILTTPTLHAMVYWNRHHHELPVAELGLADPSAFPTTSAASSSAYSVLFDAKVPSADADPTLAAAIHKSLTSALNVPITKSFNERLVFRSFLALWEEMGVGLSNVGGATANAAAGEVSTPKRIVIDCSNGVGSVIMRESLDLPITVLPEDRAYLAKINGGGSAQPLPDVLTVGELVKLVARIEFVLVHDDIKQQTLLNKDCGADHTQKTRTPSHLFDAELKRFVTENKDSIVAAVGANTTNTTEAFCQEVGRRIGFYCFDGDADRVVSFAPSPKQSGGASATATDVDGLLASTHFELLDGDRIAVLMSSLVRDALHRQLGSSQHATGGAGHHRGASVSPKMGVVQTAYANGASTNYILSKLHIPTECAATGVKYLHPKAEAMEVGIYFEANGHGTALSSASLYATTMTLPEHPRSLSASRSNSVLGAGAVVPPGAKATISAPTAVVDAPHEKTSASAIVPHVWFGKGVSSPNQGLKNLLLLRYLLSQCCGDAIADMLACELSLAVLGWTAYNWQTMYTDLPSITGKTDVRDPSVIKNTPDQRQATHPAGLQARIDDIVASIGGPTVLARSFVRPSGTEPIVRVYAEATTKELTQQLFEKVAAAVREMCN